MSDTNIADGVAVVRGLVERIYYATSKFTSGQLVTADGSVVRFVGPMAVSENEPVVLEGKWENHRKYGHQFQFRNASLDLDIEPTGLARYLENHPEFKGIGPAKANLIAETFGHDFDDVITHRPEAVAQAAKLPLTAVLSIREKWSEYRNRNAAATHLAAFGLTHAQLTALIEEFGDMVVPIFQQDPYRLVKAVPGFGFKKVDRAARKMKVPKDSPSRIRAGIEHCVNEALNDGDCWVEYENLLDRANLLLVMDDLDSRDRIERHLEDLVREGELVCSPYARLVVAKPEIEQMEQDLAAAFRSARAPHRGVPDQASLEALVKNRAPELTLHQRKAVVAALSHRIALVSGGAGTGKTYTIRTVVRICLERGLTVALAAPTGKAAKRMEEVIGLRAKTLHRLLGYNGHKFAAGPNAPINADVVIVDEFSMADVALAWHLIQAIDFRRTSLLLAGDHNQLPPVGPGNVLRDLILSEVVPTVVLKTVMRQAGELKENCLAILEGKVSATSDFEDRGRRPWYVVDQFSDAIGVRNFLLVLFEKVLAERLRFDLIRDVQVLTPTHKGPIGTQALNIALQRLIQWKLHGVVVPEVPDGWLPPLLLHDKVIQTRNNYELDVMNGAIGQVVGVSKNGDLTVDFEGKLVALERGSPARRDVRLAYSLSVHKAQGSEFPCVIVVTHKSHEFIHHRNLLYTGVTRARETAIILGDHWGIHNCAQKRRVDRRNTFLSFLLTDASELFHATAETGHLPPDNKRRAMRVGAVETQPHGSEQR